MQNSKLKNLKSFKFYVVVLPFSFCLLNFIGCVTTPYTPATITPQIPGSYHRVERGQTLWRISKIYNVDLDEIARINRISDASGIEVGQLIFIPALKKQEYTTYKSSGSEDFIWPVRGRVITFFGQTFNNMVNKGINIHPLKSQDVVAAAGGRVVFYADNFQDFGKTIIIDHGNGFLTVYARNSQVFVKTGEVVQKGALIAKVGSSGRDKNTYLHFQIRKGYVPVNPCFYLSP